MPEEQKVATPTVKWNDNNIRNAYANICNIVSTREEFSLMFGMNQRMDIDNNELIVDLSDRIVLNPYAAKRLYLLLGNVLDQYEARFAAIEIESVQGAAGAEAKAKAKAD